MLNARIAIIGGGLSGLYAAYRLALLGVTDYLLLEARDVFGGRIATASPPGAGPHERFDLGPTWFWPQWQPALDRLIADLALARFAQYETGDMRVELSPDEPPRRVRGYASSPPSMRLIGGTAALVDALRARIDPARVVVGRQVTALRCHDAHIDVTSVDVAGQSTCHRVAQVLLALPPRLAVLTITFTPALPETLADEWRDTATWMASHAKYVAVYETPFWPAQGLSGEARSARGPLGEIHDASMPGARAALFGFFGVPAHVRQRVPDEVMRAHCRAQLVRLFGPLAATPVHDAIKDWASDPLTATPLDQDGAAQHGSAPSPRPVTGAWRDRLTGIASEWSPQFPGYLAGAIDAAHLGIDALRNTLDSTMEKSV